MAVCRIKPSSVSRVRKISGMLCVVRTSRLLTRNCGTRYVGGEQSAADRSVMEKLVFSHAKHGAHIAAIRFGPPRRRTGTICNVRIGISLVEACPGAFIAVSHLEEAVLEELNRMAQEFLDKDEAAESVAFCKICRNRRNACKRRSTPIVRSRRNIQQAFAICTSTR